MKKKIALFGMLFVLIAGVSAKEIGLVVNAGAIFTHSAKYDWGTAPYKNYWTKSNGRIGGGFDLQLRYTFYKQLAVYTMFDAAFPARPDNDALEYGTYLIDWQLGLGWTFNLARNFDVFFGGGLALGGTGKKQRSLKFTSDTTNVGFGINCNFSYMFIPMVGIYAGVSDNVYVPVNVRTNTAGIKTSGKPSDRLTNAINLKLGLQLAF